MLILLKLFLAHKYQHILNDKTALAEIRFQRYVNITISHNVYAKHRIYPLPRCHAREFLQE